MMLHIALQAAAIALVVFGTANPAAAETKEPLRQGCEIASWVNDTTVALPHAAKRLKQARMLKIVALGSSSTLGSGGSGPAASWPAQLEGELARSFPGVQVAVLNKGQMRQTVGQMLARMDRDVIAEHPSLVIWEAGTAEAVRGVEPDTLMSELLTGIDRLSAEGMDVVLMDMQYARNTAKLINFQPYLDTMQRVAAMRDIHVFPRFDLMRDWVEHQQVTFEDQSKSEAIKTADEVYACLAKNLAKIVERGLRPH